jgi:hypothetical protein
VSDPGHYSGYLRNCAPPRIPSRIRFDYANIVVAGGAMPRSVQEARVRRVARRHGLELKKAGRGKPRARDFGRYWLVDAARSTLVFPDEHGGSLDDLERYLTQR